jgi:Restriction endonuclease
MATLDFSELEGNPPGEAFEALVRLIGERLGLNVQWSGRGADGGRDLYFLETQSGTLGIRAVKWLVNCKDKSESNSAVLEKDLGSILDKVQQHQCQGFLLATSTTASTALKEKLDKLDIGNGGSIQTKVWDRFELTKLLLSEQFSDLLVQFFPKHNARNAAQQIDAARERIESSLPRFVAGKVRSCLISHADRYACLSGASVWPHDADQQNKIDTLRMFAIRPPRRRALDLLEELDFDVFIAFVDQLIRNFPTRAKELLVAFGKATNDNARLFNSIEILREDDDFDLSQELEITQRCDSETLFELYRDLIHQDLEDASIWEDRLTGEMRRMADEVSVTDASLEEVEFTGGDGISFSATVSLDLEGVSGDPEGGWRSNDTFSCRVTGHVSGDGIEIDSVQ